MPTELLHAQGEKPLQHFESKSTSFVHPGILQTRGQLEAMKRMIQTGEEPVAGAWKLFMELHTASLDFDPKPAAHVFRGANGANRSGADEFASSGQAAHSHVLQWYVSADAKHAEKAITILDAWSQTLWDFSGNDAKLLAGWTGAYFCEAAELLRSYPGWKQESRTKFRHMLTRVLIPLLAPFFPEANGNWDGAIVFTVLAIAIYLDDHALFNHATHHLLYGSTNAGILKYVWPSGQCEESTRDQGHVQLGLGYFSYAALVAWNQGVDIFGVGNNRLALGFEYTSKYMLDEEVPYFGVISPRSRGKFSDFYEAAFQHYRFDKKIEMPYTARAAQKARDNKAMSAVWLYRGGQMNVPLASPPRPESQGVNAGAHDTDLTMQPSWHSVLPGESLQSAIDRGADGDTILIAPGIHTVASSIRLRSGLTLMGAGRQSVLHLAQDGGEYCLIQGSAKLERLTLRNFLIEGALSTDWPMDPNQPRRERSTQMARPRGGILLSGDAEGDIRKVVLDHLTVRNCVSNGISISGAADVIVSDCDLTDNGGNNAPGNGLNHNLLLNHVSQCVVNDSRLVFSLGGCGVSVQNSSRVTVQRSELSRNCGYGAEFMNCTDVKLLDSLLEANNAGAYRSETDGTRSTINTALLLERLNGN